MTDVIKVVIADSEEVFVQGLEKILTEHPQIQVVSRCHKSEEIVQEGRRIHPDVLLVEDELTGEETASFVKSVTEDCPETKIAILKRQGEINDGFSGLKAGARAYLSKNISPEDLVKSIELISSGRIIISPVFAQQFTDSLNTRTMMEEHPSGEEVTQREREVATMIAHGKTNREIATELYISENTVKMHVKNTLGKLELKNRQQLSVYAVLHEWIRQEDKPHL
ncbi:DNA-binding response regulator, NarL/FixJ family [Dehalogenimonas formicexedens]|uniref:DNA-binding response regulator, NarL/FixJ family n=1 Tax=Dehalogenimonas formicexedens TaxID=1839801 RepID=A0A1P8F7A7_9CHLR|nr:response regulator transcription factor [Dehalogenimonas formicexedens]APV44305.1 DNA-binding response regulator, NarL/FixJ family [Dehalogenimonas formicexedens]